MDDGLELAGWVANSVDPDFERRRENVVTLERMIPAPLLAEFPWLAASDRDAPAAHRDGERWLRIAAYGVAS